MTSLNFIEGDYITKKEKAVFPSLQTMQIRYFSNGEFGAICTTSIGGTCSVFDLRDYRRAETDEIVDFLTTLANAYKQR